MNLQKCVPEIPTFKFRCKECVQKFKVEREFSGEWIHCPKCGSDIEIPFMKIAAPVSFSSPALSETVTMKPGSIEQPKTGYVKKTVTQFIGDESLTEVMPKESSAECSSADAQPPKKKTNVKRRKKGLAVGDKATSTFKVKAKSKGKKLSKKAS